MSTPAHNNDELFRQGLEDYREMPPLKVWEGVEAALDQDKKKRRFLFWLWFAGGSSSLAAVLLMVPVLMGEPTPETNPTARTAIHVAPTVELAMGERPLAVTADKNSTRPGENASVLADAGTSSTAVHPKTSAAASPSQHSKNQEKHTANSTPSLVNQAGFTSSPSHSSNTSGEHADNASQPGANAVASKTEPVTNTSGTVPPTRTEIAARRTPLTPITLATTGAEALQNSLFLTPATLTEKHERDELTIMRGVIAGSPFIQPTLSVQGYTGAVAYRRGQPTNQNTNEYVLALPNEQTEKPKKFGVYSGAIIKAGVVIKRHWYVNVGIGYENHYFADRYNFQVPGEVYNTATDTTTTLNPPAIPSVSTYEGITTNAAFGNAVIPLPSAPAPADIANGIIKYVELNGKLTYQLHQLILPIDFGYRYSYKRFGVYVGGSAAFHVPLAQKALFYADSGPIREVKLSPVTPFNFSVGVEPGVEYNFAKRFSLLAGGTFRYQVLNAHKGEQLSKPYILSGHLGIRVSL